MATHDNNIQRETRLPSSENKHQVLIQLLLLFEQDVIPNTVYDNEKSKKKSKPDEIEISSC